MTGVAQLVPTGKVQWTDDAGNPLTSGLVYFYVPGTTTFQNTWQDPTQTTLNPNPVPLDARGEAIVYGVGEYRQVVYDADGNLIYDVLTFAISTAAQLANNGVPGGAGTIGFDGNTLDQQFLTRVDRVVPSIAALRSILHTTYNFVHVAGYYAPADGGGGFYAYIASDNSSSDNGGTIIVGAGGARWHLQTTEPVSIKQFGAKMDGTTNDSAAWQSAIAAVADLYVPAGNSVVSPLTFSGLNGTRITGAGAYASQITLASTGIAFTFSNCQNMTIRDIYCTPAAGLTNTTGITFGAGAAAGNNYVERCQFSSFSLYGLDLEGTSSQPMSGNVVRDCLFLSNAGAGLRSEWSADFWYEGNQFGILPSAVHPAYGAFLDNSSAGTYTRNYHWNNVIGFQMQNSNYNRVEINRFEESDQQGVFLNGCTRTIFSGNTLHTNSEASKGTYDSAYFANCDTIVIDGNDTFDWNAGTTGHRYSYSVNAGCNNVEIGGNTAEGYVTGPWFFDPSLTTASINANASVTGNSGTSLAAGASYYIGAAVANANPSGVGIMAARQAAIFMVFVACDNEPGAGQTFTYTLFKNAASTGITLTISGTSSFFAEIVSNTVVVEQNDTFYLQVTASAGAAVAFHRFFISQVDF